jgi:hypothetical protein
VCGKYEAGKSNPIVLMDFAASLFFEGVRELDRSRLAPNLLFLKVLQLYLYLFGYALAPPISGPLNAISMRSTLLESLWA